MPKNITQRKYVLAIALASISSLLSIPQIFAQEQCSFNGRWEACKIYKYTKNGNVIARKVIWLSDGKSVTYHEYDCSTPDEYTSMHECKVKIVEDNGRVTYGTLFHGGGRGISIRSQRGNTTILPP